MIGHIRCDFCTCKAYPEESPLRPGYVILKGNLSACSDCLENMVIMDEMLNGWLELKEETPADDWL